MQRFLVVIESAATGYSAYFAGPPRLRRHRRFPRGRRAHHA